jgi:hypothetical protein
MIKITNIVALLLLAVIAGWFLYVFWPSVQEGH